MPSFSEWIIIIIIIIIVFSSTRIKYIKKYFQNFKTKHEK
jgi:Sec-independent protein translocase protein TatA